MDREEGKRRKKHEQEDPGIAAVPGGTWVALGAVDTQGSLSCASHFLLSSLAPSCTCL